MYHLSSSQSDRINYDDANRMWFEECLSGYLAAGGEIKDIDEATFKAFWNADGMEDERVDDIEEAEARARSVFAQVIAEAR